LLLSDTFRQGSCTLANSSRLNFSEQENEPMKPVLLALLILPVTNALFAQTKPSKVSEILIQMERDWSQADVQKDTAALNRILAEDWIGVDFQGTVMTKADVLKELAAHSDVTATESTEISEIKVRIFGNTGLVSGTEFEKSQYRGKDSSGKYIWMDVFVLREGRWQAVASQSTKLVAPEEPTAIARLRPAGDDVATAGAARAARPARFGHERKN
jgi:hypothetical protein